MTFEYQIKTTKGQMLRICVLQRGKVGGYWVKSLNSVRNRWNFSNPPNSVVNSEIGGAKNPAWATNIPIESATAIPPHSTTIAPTPTHSPWPHPAAPASDGLCMNEPNLKYFYKIWHSTPFLLHFSNMVKWGTAPRDVIRMAYVKFECRVWKHHY